ncbi:hypothetical protein BDW69DRAFT_190703 [Aspergillus filifer]
MKDVDTAAPGRFVQNQEVKKSIAARPGPSAAVKIFDDDTFDAAVRKWGIWNGRSGVLYLERRSRANTTSSDVGSVRCLPFWGYKHGSEHGGMVLVYAMSDPTNPQHPTSFKSFRNTLVMPSSPTRRERLAIAQELAASVYGIQQVGWTHGNLSSNTVWMGQQRKTGKQLI